MISIKYLSYSRGRKTIEWFQYSAWRADGDHIWPRFLANGIMIIKTDAVFCIKEINETFCGREKKDII
jgi:hypothetical protein